MLEFKKFVLRKSSRKLYEKTFSHIHVKIIKTYELNNEYYTH